ncbi:hypothetical protein WCL09_00650 [Pseudomonas koreensis]|uniref:hypothetical protein n=1 Tax=Pseudomonas koreensis TaxID=198620 RepID=UPI00301842A9
MEFPGLTRQLLIDPELWSATRSGARAGRGFRYQDAVAAWLASVAWSGEATWTRLIPEGVDDLTLHGPELEFRAQLKARHDPQGVFSQAETAKHLAKSAKDLPHDWLESNRVRLALVLERPLEGIQPTGWIVTLAESDQDLTKFGRFLAEALGQPENGVVEALLARTHLVIEPNPLDRGCAALTSASLSPAGVRLVLQQLREQAGKASDSNYSASSEKPETLDRSDVQTRIDGVQGIIDPIGYVALTDGLAEIANFSEPMPAGAFYQGVNVAPGHVGAGLVFARPELMADILTGLEAKRFTLVAGPSGAGKSALAWLSAHHTRHAVRWYRIRELQVSDVAKLVQLAKLLEASPERPVGFVVDDVGRQETAGWDALVREVEAQAGLLTIGTVREEDIFLLSSAARTPTIRPKLDESLAYGIWKALQASSPVAFSHWQEPFELSNGLLLEYTHLLTAGERLEETIREQVRRRLAEDRGDELMILRTISFAAAQGAAIDPVRLRMLSGMDEPRFAKLLQRLVDEHAVRAKPDGALTGLHEIRSTYLDGAIRDLLGEARSRAVTAAAETLASDTFAPFIVRVLRQWPEEEAAMLGGLVARLKSEEGQCWPPVLHGLGLASADRVAEKWLEISRSADIDDRLSGFTFMFTLASVDFGDEPMFAKPKIAHASFSKVDVADLRKILIEMAKDAWPTQLSVSETAELAATLLPIAGCKSPPSIRCLPSGDLSEAPLEDLLTLLITLREVDLDAARTVVDMSGGTTALISRLYNERPWVTRPEIGESDGMLSVTGYVRFVHPEVQPDLNEEVVRLCTAMSAVIPDAELLIADAIFSDGSPVGYGEHSQNSKRMPRHAVIAPARIAWNQAEIRAINRLVAAPTETQRTTDLAVAVNELGVKLREAGDFYCRMETPGAKWKMLLQIRDWLTTFIQPPSINESLTGPLSVGNLSESDKLHDFVTGLQRLMTELTDGVSEKPNLMAARTASLVRDAELLHRPELWRMTSEPPLEMLVQIADTLRQIRAVLADAAMNPEQRGLSASRFRTMSRRHSVLRRAAEDAFQRADSLTSARREQIRLAMADKGLDVEVYSRSQPESSGAQWPDAEFAVLLKVETLFDWLTTEESFSAVAAALSPQVTVSYGAVINGRLAPMGMTFIVSLFPDATFADKWKDSVPYSPIIDEDLRLYDEALEAIGAMSAACAESGREMNAKELEFVTIMMERCGRSMECIATKLEGSADDVLIDVAGSLSRVFSRFQNELENEVAETVASDLSASLRGTMSDLMYEVLGIRLALMERAALQLGSSDVQSIR